MFVISKGFAAGRVILVAALMVLALAHSVLASTKKALVIGNSAYDTVADLKNPANDATDVARTLESIGFEVDLRLDLNQIDLLRAFQEFQFVAENAEMALIYYAGHGIEIDKKNYLVPVSAALKTDRDVIFEAVPLDTALLAVEGASKVSLVIVDACRDNPFAATMVKTSATRSVGRGLAVVEPQGNTLVAYAAREGTTASDGSGRNSPYAEALIEVLNEPGVEIGKLFRRVRDQVLRSTNNRQEPFVYGSLSADDIFLNPEQVAFVPEPEPEPVAPPVQVAPPAEDRGGFDPQVERVFWESVKDSSDPRDLEDYIDLFPNGIFKRLAERRLAILKRAEAATTMAPAGQALTSQLPETNAQPAPSVSTTPTPSPAAPTVDTAALAPSQPEAPTPAPTPAPAPTIAAEPATPEVTVPDPVPQAPSVDVAALAEPSQPSAPATESSRIVLIDPADKTPTLGVAQPQTDQLAALQPEPQVQTPVAQPRVNRNLPPYQRNRETIRTIQRQLNILGHNTGRPDGVSGRKTRAGMNAFLASLGLPPKQRLDAEVYDLLNNAVSPDRLAFTDGIVNRIRANSRLRLATLHGAYCLERADGTYADGLNGRPLVCTFVRAVTSSTIETITYYEHLRNARGNAVFPIYARAQAVNDTTFTDEDGSTLTIANGILSINGNNFRYTGFDG